MSFKSGLDFEYIQIKVYSTVANHHFNNPTSSQSKHDMIHGKLDIAIWMTNNFGVIPKRRNSDIAPTFR